MNRVLRTIIDILAMIIFCITVIYFFSTFNAGAKYTKTGYINHVCGDKISVIDEDGKEWEFYGEEWKYRGDGFEQGQRVTVILHNNGTNHIEDDRIVGVEIL